MRENETIAYPLIHVFITHTDNIVRVCKTTSFVNEFSVTNELFLPANDCSIHGAEEYKSPTPFIMLYCQVYYSTGANGAFDFSTFLEIVNCDFD